MGARIARAIFPVYDTVRADRCPTRRQILICPNTSTHVNAMADSPHQPPFAGLAISSLLSVYQGR
jgi:hypothetical protein